MRKLGYLLLFMVVLLALGQLAWHVTKLPAEVATHFGPGGEADGFMSLKSYALFMLGLMLGLPAFFVGLGKLARFLPNSMINVPHKDYWLHPDRRAQTMLETETVLVWITVATEVFFVGLSQLMFYANIRQQNLSGLGFAILMAVYMTFIVGICVFLVWRYQKPPVVT